MRLTRHDHDAPDPARVRPLGADHPAVVGARSQFVSRVFNAADVPRLLISGVNSKKLGKRVSKGKWSGLEVFTLTLEERATCPRTCAQWRTCYGNSTHLARRIRIDASFWPRLESEVAQLLRAYPAGILVRLHSLGDFPDVDYTRRWLGLMFNHPRLHIFGYTARAPESDIGRVVQCLNGAFRDRCLIRFSNGPVLPWRDTPRAVVIDHIAAGRTPDGIVCPQQSDQTACCATCGLCWSAPTETIVFILHGNRNGPARIAA
jgi:hypothetical protein